MLQIKIIHREDGTSIVSEILDSKDGKINKLAEFDYEKNCVDFDIIKDRIGDEILLDHYNGNQYDYSARKTLTKVDYDNDGIGFIAYS